MTEKLYTLAEARLMIEIERLEQEIRRLNGVIVLRDAKCGRLNLTIDETVTAWENRAIEKDNEISKMENIEYPLTAGLRKRIAGLEHENARLKERLRWVPVSERLPELDQDVEVLDVDTKHIIVGHFFDYNEGEPDSEIMFDEHGIGEYYSLDILPKKCHWRYAALPEVK